MLPDDILLETFHCVRLAACRCSTPRPAIKPGCDICDYEGVRGNGPRMPKVAIPMFASPHRLDHDSSESTRKAHIMKKALSSRSTLPIAAWYPSQCIIPEDENNASFARIPIAYVKSTLSFTNSFLSKTCAQLLAAFPALEYLRLESPYPESESPPRF